ncbi:hypothetical protein J2Y38_004673 [Flavobacterium sp. 2755]|uniref:hypothetical protein n=1 Tax=Flavobacterium sp. 2755 TaxID=2817765 RepID=UPI00285E2539|nr:hypothetical protein [Flavobacterium sp. 2755]MDR6764440.1 hypothetical protein [Flavobacterium sp. 2755]
MNILKYSLILLSISSIISCKEAKTTKVSVVKDKIQSVKNDQINDFIGEYECKNNDNPDESLFLMLKKIDIESNFEGISWEDKNEKGEVTERTLIGGFYGNTDFFMNAREGYDLGYFVAKIKVEPFEDNLLKVNVFLDPSDVLEKPVQPPILSTKEALLKGNKKWEVTELKIYSALYFEIKNSKELVLKSDFGDLLFKKIK